MPSALRDRADLVEVLAELLADLVDVRCGGAGELELSARLERDLGLAARQRHDGAAVLLALRVPVVACRKLAQDAQDAPVTAVRDGRERRGVDPVLFHLRADPPVTPWLFGLVKERKEVVVAGDGRIVEEGVHGRQREGHFGF